MPPDSAPKNPSGKLNFTKEEKAVGKLEKKADKINTKLEKAQGKLPAKKVKKEQFVFDEKKNKAASKLTHEIDNLPSP